MRGFSTHNWDKRGEVSSTSKTLRQELIDSPTQTKLSNQFHPWGVLGFGGWGGWGLP